MLITAWSSGEVVARGSTSITLACLFCIYMPKLHVFTCVGDISEVTLKCDVIFLPQLCAINFLLTQKDQGAPQV